jgi:hypothetical protein
MILQLSKSIVDFIMFLLNTLILKSSPEIWGSKSIIVPVLIFLGYRFEDTWNDTT